MASDDGGGRPHQQPYTFSVHISPRGLPTSPLRHESDSPFNIFALAIHLYPCRAHCHHSSRHTKVSSAGINQSDGLSPRSLTVASLGFIFLRGTYSAWCYMVTFITLFSVVCEEGSFVGLVCYFTLNTWNGLA